MCAYPGMDGKTGATSKDFSMDYLKYMAVHYKMQDSVQPAYPPSTAADAKKLSQNPLLVKDEVMFLKIAMKTVEDLKGNKHDVGFVGTNTGIVIKFVSIIKV